MGFYELRLDFLLSALPASTSFLFASTLTILTFAGMQMFKTNLASSEWMTILGGFIGSQMFIFLLTVSLFSYYTQPFWMKRHHALLSGIILCRIQIPWCDLRRVHKKNNSEMELFIKLLLLLLLLVIYFYRSLSFLLKSINFTLYAQNLVDRY